MNPFRTRPSGLAMMLGSVILFSSNTLLVRAASIYAPEANGWIAIWFRSAVGLGIVASVFGFQRGLVWKNLFSNRLVLVRGIIGGLTTIAFYITVIELGAARAIVLNLTYPAFASVIAMIWLGEKIRRSAAVWMGISLLGLWLFLSDNGTWKGISGYDWLALAGAVGSGWVVVMIRKLRHAEHPATIFASLSVFGLLFSAPATVNLGTVPLWICGVLSAAAALVTIAQLLMTRAYQDLPVAQGASLQMLAPIMTTLGAYLLLGETLQSIQLIGAGITMLATWRVVMTPPPSRELAIG